jgi:hypothetical protein
MYKLPSPDGGLEAYYADDFNSLEAETQRSYDPRGLYASVDSTTLTQRSSSNFLHRWGL